MQMENQHPSERIASKINDSHGITLWPYCSLSPRAAMILMTGITGAGIAMSLVFFLLGAWPVIGFVGLEIGLVFWVFRAHYLGTKRRYERITTIDPSLYIERADMKGRVEVESLPLSWLNVHLEATDKENLPEGDRHLITRQKLFVTSRGRKIEIGGFLPYQEKPAVAKALNKMIREREQI
jgi:uncharacterized membrane protein